mmetsp:Transcript_65764/g.130302  ORF Transcript_65764/g.130302 Transcript_65764/m.130302 type:complete len:235 (+) Transcript_65764:463-1167(+)
MSLRGLASSRGVSTHFVWRTSPVCRPLIKDTCGLHPLTTSCLPSRPTPSDRRGWLRPCDGRPYHSVLPHGWKHVLAECSFPNHPCHPIQSPSRWLGVEVSERADVATVQDPPHTAGWFAADECSRTQSGSPMRSLAGLRCRESHCPRMALPYLRDQKRMRTESSPKTHSRAMKTPSPQPSPLRCRSATKTPMRASRARPMPTSRARWLTPIPHHHRRRRSRRPLSRTLPCASLR